jgi:nicotinamide mononucleotide transporter
MVGIIADWVSRNWVEIAGAILGMAYVFLSIKQHILTWLLGLMTSVLYIIVFFNSGFYADMLLQSYYVLVSVYGWIVWAKGTKTEGGKEQFQVTKTTKRLALILIPISLIVWFLIWIILKKFTDSIVPIGDSFTTAMSIVATWMLARKKLEHWIIWVVVDAVCIILFLWKGLYPTVALYIVYTVAAVWGYFEWSNDLKLKNDVG